MLDENKNLIRRYYAGLWNRWDDAVVDEIIAPDIEFRGSLGITVRGRDGFRGYVARVRAAFPDFHNQIDQLLAEGDTEENCTGRHPRANALSMAGPLSSRSPRDR